MPLYDADELEDLILKEGQTLSVIILEPVMANGGVHISPKNYSKVREICDKYGILMIFDEIITAFGELENGFVWNIMVFTLNSFLSKGITSGYLPLSATSISKKVWKEIENKTPPGLFFGGALTSSNHATSCSAALANIEIIEKRISLITVKSRANTSRSIKSKV